MVLLFGIFLLWSTLNTPSREEMLARQRVQDSIAIAEQVGLKNSTNPVTRDTNTTQSTTATGDQYPDSLRQIELASRYGSLAGATQGTEEFFTLENDKVRITFTNKGGRITDVLLKKYQRILLDEKRKEYFAPLHLLEDSKNIFEYILPSGDKPVRTSDLYFDVQEEAGAITFTAKGTDGSIFRQSYKLGADSYAIDYDVVLDGLPYSANNKSLKLNWVNYLDKVEKNTGYEKFYTSVYYKETDSDTPDYCSCRDSDTDDLSAKPLRWVSHSNQFFNSSLIADERFSGGVMSTEMTEDGSDDLKILRTELNIPLKGSGQEQIGMTMYIGPNDFEELRAFNANLEDIIPFGMSIFGTINRWVIRPIFNVLSDLVPNKGLVILLLTLLVKILLYPLTYKMLHSQAKMGALKPQLAGLREKHKDDMQKQQMETMKVYREYGVSPLGGCLPMVLQMPIWFALYRFFPASIEFRQAKFLWATDLSSYDVMANLPFEIPFYGAHISMFTLLWAATTVMYTYYTMKFTDMGAMGNNPMFKYMQYFMPVLFLFFFNNYASGLTLYLLFSNLVNIGLTLGTKEFIFDDAKISAELALNKEKPKKRSAFSERLEKAMKEQQRVAQERNKTKSKK